MEDPNLYYNLHKAMEAAEVAWWEMRLPGGKLKFGATKTDLLGYRAGDFKHYTDFTALVDNIDYEPMMQAMRDHLEGRTDLYEALFRIKAADGSYKTYYDRGRIVERTGDTLILTGITTNIDTINGYLFKTMADRYVPIKPEELGL